MTRTAGLLLAAGGSSRLGRPKQLVRLAGESLLRRAARALVDGGLAPVVVVLGAHAEACAAELLGLPVTTVEHPDWARGPGSSLRAGLAALASSDVDAVVVAVVDQPALDAGHVRALVEAAAAAPGATVASTYAGAVGVPALFPRVRFSELGALPDGAGARALLVGAREVPLPGGERDVDRPEDLAALLVDGVGRGRG